MRASIQIILFAILFPCLLPAEEIITGLISFDPPPFLRGGIPGGGPGENPFSGVGRVRVYFASDNSGQSHRQVDVNLRLVGFIIGEGKRVTLRQLDDKAFRTEMETVIKRSDGATNVSAVTDANLGGQPALQISYEEPAPNFRKDAVMEFDIYWVLIQSNRVIEVKLAADSKGRLGSLEDCLSGFKITKNEEVLKRPLVFPARLAEERYEAWISPFFPIYIIPRICAYYQLHPERFKPTGQGEEIDIEGFGDFVAGDDFFKSGHFFHVKSGQIMDPWDEPLHFVEDINMDGFIDARGQRREVTDVGVLSKIEFANKEHHFGICKHSLIGIEKYPWVSIIAETYHPYSSK